MKWQITLWGKHGGRYDPMTVQAETSEKALAKVKKDMGKCVTSKCQWILYLDEIPCGRDVRGIDVLSQYQFRAQ